MFSIKILLTCSWGKKTISILKNGKPFLRTISDYREHDNYLILYCLKTKNSF